MSEEWRDVVGFPGYMVSSLGRIMSTKRAKTRLLAQHPQTNGYLKVVLSRDGKKKTVRAHSVVAEAFLGPRLTGQCVRHLDGNQKNNSADNLAYGTNSENSVDVVVHGRHRLAKLTYEVAAEIKWLYASGNYSYRALGDMFGVSNSQISRVVNNQTWRRGR